MIIYLLLPLGLLALSFYCIGYISFEKGLPPVEGGFEASSMNLISPLLGTHLAPSVFIPSFGLKLDATGLQIDGHNYLGIALILGLGFIITTKIKLVIGFFQAHWLMTILMVGFTVYSMSNTVYVFDKVILHYTLPKFVVPVTQIFRGSGRFFWPVGYALLLIFMVFFLNHQKKMRSIVLLILLTLQYVDTVHHREYLKEAAGRTSYFAYPPADWDILIKKADTVYFLPAYGCGGDGLTALFIQYFTARNGIPFNTGFIARINSNCAAKEMTAIHHQQDRSLFIFSKNKFSPDYVQNIMGENFPDWCREHAIGTVCQIGGNAKSWSKVDQQAFQMP